MRYKRFATRPASFRLNQSAPHYKGLIAAYLGMQGPADYWDSGPYALHGTLNNYSGSGKTPPESWTQQIGRRVLNVAGIGTLYASAPNITGFFSGGLSIMAWARVASSFGSVMLLSEAPATTTATGFNLEFVAGPVIQFRVHASALATATAGAPTLATWGHFAGTYDGANAFALFNGKPGTVSTSASGNVLTNANALAIGALSTGTTGMTGSVGDAIFANFAWPQSWISEIADPANVMLEVGGTPLIVPLHSKRYTPRISGGPFPWFTDNELCGGLQSMGLVC